MIQTKDLIEKIKECFLTEDKYQMRKVIEEFSENQKFIGDYYNFFIFEHEENKSPIFYHVLSPYDVVTNQAPQLAIVWQEGKNLLNIDFTEYAAMRTGVMDALVLVNTNESSLKDKKILILGGGKTAKWSLKGIKDIYSDLTSIDYTATKKNEEFEKFAKDLGVESNYQENLEISKYDYIFCHTNAKNAVLTLDMIESIKKGAIITTYISSTENGEVSDEYYSSKKANVILDWKLNLSTAKDLNRAVEKNFIKEDEIVFLSDLLNGVKLPEKEYSIFRFKGTPIQNLAVLKLLKNN